MANWSLRPSPPSDRSPRIQKRRVPRNSGAVQELSLFPSSFFTRETFEPRIAQSQPIVFAPRKERETSESHAPRHVFRFLRLSSFFPLSPSLPFFTFAPIQFSFRRFVYLAGPRPPFLPFLTTLLSSVLRFSSLRAGFITRRGCIRPPLRRRILQFLFLLHFADILRLPHRVRKFRSQRFREEERQQPRDQRHASEQNQRQFRHDLCLRDRKTRENARERCFSYYEDCLWGAKMIKLYTKDKESRKQIETSRLVKRWSLATRQIWNYTLRELYFLPQTEEIYQPNDG